MLVEKEVQVNKIVAIKVSSGEEIIAFQTKEDDVSIHVKRPLILIMTEVPNSPQRTQVVFAPWMLGISHEETVILKKQNILFMSEAVEDAASEYEKATGLKRS